MHLWEYSDVGGNVSSESSCCSLETIEDARAICHKLNIPHYVINLKVSFQKEVIQNFIDEYLAGRTPNPCVQCNHRVKWGDLLRLALKIGADKIATGHYVRLGYDSKRQRYIMLKGVDETKDQSYALWGLSQEQLARTIFPVGELSKTDVRNKAAKIGLKTAFKSDSQEICFIPDNNYERFIKEKLPNLEDDLKNGEVIDETGQVIGYHRGYPFYTIGQRKGLRVATGERIYVNHIDAKNNRIYIGKQEKLFNQGLRATSVNWVASDGNFSSMEVTAKIRYNDPGFPAIVRPLSPETIQVEFSKAQKSVTPGQSVVLYHDDEVIGGGIIDEALE